jgi:hypothetical protein
MENRKEECSLLPPGVESSGKGTVAGGSAAAHSPAPALLPHIIGLPTMLHTATNIKQSINTPCIRFDATTTTTIIIQLELFFKKSKSDNVH